MNFKFFLNIENKSTLFDIFLSLGHKFYIEKNIICLFQEEEEKARCYLRFFYFAFKIKLELTPLETF